MNLIAEDETQALRALVIARDPRVWVVDGDRIWAPKDGPIEIVEASGRARCRACGERIEKGASAIRFGFKPNPIGFVGAAYIHERCPEEGTS